MATQQEGKEKALRVILRGLSPVSLLTSISRPRGKTHLSHFWPRSISGCQCDRSYSFALVTGFSLYLSRPGPGGDYQIWGGQRIRIWTPTNKCCLKEYKDGRWIAMTSARLVFLLPDFYFMCSRP